MNPINLGKYIIQDQLKEMFWVMICNHITNSFRFKIMQREIFPLKLYDFY